MPIAFLGKTLIFTDSDKKFDLGGDISDMMTNYKLIALSKEQPKDKKFLLDVPDEIGFGNKFAGDKSTREDW